MSEKIETYDPAKRQVVYAGTFDPGTKIFSKIVNPNHFMKREQGYGIQQDVLHQLIEKGCEQIWIITLDGVQHQSKLQDWLDRVPKDYGNGLQTFMKLSDMTIPPSDSTRLWE